jgi:hypothetical protein
MVLLCHCCYFCHAVFLAVFKWEARKGWKDLIQGFTAAFKPTDPAVLWILARPFMESGTVSSIDTMTNDAAMNVNLSAFSSQVTLQCCGPC